MTNTKARAPPTELEFVNITFLPRDTRERGVLIKKKWLLSFPYYELVQDGVHMKKI